MISSGMLIACWLSIKWRRQRRRNVAVLSGTTRSTSTRSVANVEYVLEFLQQVKAGSPAGYDRIQYIEQPTNRDLKANPDNKMHKAAELKPVVIDESLVDYESLLLAREQGYSGCRPEGLQRTHRSPAGCGGCPEVWDVPVRAGSDLPRPVVPALRQPGGAHPRRGCDRRKRPPVLPGGEQEARTTYAGMFEFKDGMVATGLLNAGAWVLGMPTALGALEKPWDARIHTNSVTCDVPLNHVDPFFNPPILTRFELPEALSHEGVVSFRPLFMSGLGRFPDLTRTRREHEHLHSRTCGHQRPAALAL